MEYKAVVFDMDGVIFDSERLVLACWEEAAGHRGISGIKQVFYQCIGTNANMTRQVLQSHYGEAFDDESFRKEASALYHLRFGDGRALIKPGAEELLSYLKEQGIPAGLASSTRRTTVEREIRAAGLLPYFETIICGDMVTKSKPEPEIFLKACEGLGAAARDTIAIEDSFNGIRAAWRAGMFPVMVPDIIAPDEEMKELAGLICRDLFEVKAWIEEMVCKGAGSVC